MNKNNGRILIRMGLGKESRRKSVSFAESSTKTRVISSCHQERSKRYLQGNSRGWGEKGSCSLARSTLGLGPSEAGHTRKSKQGMTCQDPVTLK